MRGRKIKMKVAVRVSSDLGIELGLSLGELIERLEKGSVNYEKVYDKVNDNTGVLETVVFIREEGIEILLEEHKVVYIKSACNEYNTIAENGNLLTMTEALEKMSEFVLAKSSATANDLFVERFNADTMASIITIHDAESTYRVNIVMNNKNTIYMTTVRDAHNTKADSEEIDKKLEQFRG